MVTSTMLLSSLIALASLLSLSGTTPVPVIEKQGRDFNSRFAPKARPVFPRTLWENITLPGLPPITLPPIELPPLPTLPNLPELPKHPHHYEAREASPEPAPEALPEAQPAPQPIPEPVAQPAPNPVVQADVQNLVARDAMPEPQPAPQPIPPYPISQPEGLQTRTLNLPPGWPPSIPLPPNLPPDWWKTHPFPPFPLPTGGWPFPWWDPTKWPKNWP